jgi:hypothetical protein
VHRPACTFSAVPDLVEEFAVRVLAKEGFSDGRGGGFLQQLQPGLEGVVDLNLAIAANDYDTSGTVTRLVKLYGKETW